MGEEHPDEIRGNPRSNPVGPIELNDFLPGAGKNFHPSAMPYPIEDVTNGVSHVEQEARNVQSLLQSKTEQLYPQVAEPAHQIESRLYGQAANKLDAIGSTIGKLQSKLDGNATDKMTAIYARMTELGFPVPTLEQVKYGNMTGDYLGSLQMTDVSPGGYVPTPQPIQPINQQFVQPQPVNVGIIQQTLPGGTGGDTLPGGGGGGVLGGGGQLVGPKNCAVVIADKANGKVAPPTCPCPPGTLYWVAWGFPTDQACTAYLNAMGADSTECFHPCPGGQQGGGGPTGTNCDICPPGMYQWKDDKTGNCFYTLNGTPGSIKGATLVKKCPDVPPPPPIQPPGGDDGGKCCPPQPPPIVNVDLNCPTDGGGSTKPPNLICDTTPPQVCKPVDPFRTPKMDLADSGFCLQIENLTTDSRPQNITIDRLINAVIPQTDDSVIGGIIKRAITGSNQPVLATLVNAFGQWLGNTQKEILKAGPCDSLNELGWASIHGIAKLIDKWFGLAPEALLVTLQQVENYVCQYKMPDQSSADRALLANEIDRAVWECWTKTNGNYVEAAEKGVDTLRTRPTPKEWAQLYRRKQINIADLQQQMRKDGVIREEDSQAFFNLTQDWPTLSVLIPWLVRDVFDEDTIDWSQADKLFKDKYTDKTKYYSDAIGVPEEVFKYQWRAHFKLPSWTMAIDMFHRFRNLPENDPLHMSQEKLRKLLIQDDWEPQWVDRIIATSYSLLRLVDIRRAYEIRSIDDDKLKEQLRKRGLNDDDTDTMANYWKKQRDLRDNVKAGMPTVKSLIGSYAKCEIDEDTFTDILAKVVESDEQQRKAIDAANAAKQISDRKDLIKSLEWQCKRGLVDETEMSQKLSDADVSAGCIDDIIGRIRLKCKRMPKELAAGQICTMLERGVLNPTMAFDALLKIGYDSDRATLMLKNCQVGISIKERKAAEAEARRIQAEQRRLAKELEKRRRLEECGPPPCPKRPGPPKPSKGAGQSKPDQTSNGTVSTNGQAPKSP